MEKKIRDITAQNVDFAKWYTDVVVKSGLAAYSNVKGCIYIPQYGTAVWELFKSEFDARLRQLGYGNVMFPLLMPKSLLQKEKDHIGGFSPETAILADSGDDPLLIRPTSEALFCDYFANNLQSYKQLPLRLNQWANVVRLEKNTRPFLRTTEFFWQEGHALFPTEDEARTEAQRIHKLYVNFCRDVLAIPVIAGQKTESEKFAGAVDTYTIEAMMKDGQALQSATSHYLGTGFMSAFDVRVQGREGKMIHPHYISFGLSTRLVGGMVMTHGDDNGLVLPPRIAPIQAIIIPVQQHKDGVLDAANQLASTLSRVIRINVDASDNTPGWKFAEYEMKGVPLRIEIGPRDIEAGTVTVATRFNGEKQTIAIADLPKAIPALLDQVHNAMLHAATSRLNSRIHKDITTKEAGFINAAWCGAIECETAVKKNHGLSSRCIINTSKDKCVTCNGLAKHSVIWGRAY